MATMAIRSMGIRAIRSFSISYHLGEFNQLRANGMPIFGCSFVDGAMSTLGAGREPVTMKMPGRVRGSNTEVVSTFIKSTPVSQHGRGAQNSIFWLKDAILYM